MNRFFAFRFTVHVDIASLADLPLPEELSAYIVLRMFAPARTRLVAARMTATRLAFLEES